MSDRTPGGARLLADLRPGESSEPRELTAFGGRLYFEANDGTGPALWVSDGTAAGTRIVRDTWPGSDRDGGASWLTAVGNRLFFVAGSPGQGYELWRSNGTAAGTALVADLVPGAQSSHVHDVVAVGNRFYFVAEAGPNRASGQELWVSDGTRQGTRQLTRFAKRQAFVGRHFLALPRAAEGNRLVFRADDGVHGVEAWVTDGTPAGTRLLRDVCPGPCSGASFWLEEHGARAYFQGESPARGNELWTTDGTPAGTRQVRDLCPGRCSSHPFAPYAWGHRFFFVARNTAGVDQIWRTDGTHNGTVQISNFGPGEGINNAFFGVVLPGLALFAARTEEHGVELWRSNGTRAGTRLVRDINDAVVDPVALAPTASASPATP